jgi:hypothetical protein
MVCAETEAETTHRANRAEERDYEFPSQANGENEPGEPRVWD